MICPAKRADLFWGNTYRRAVLKNKEEYGRNPVIPVTVALMLFMESRVRTSLPCRRVCLLL